MKANLSYRTGAAGILLLFFFLLPSLVSLYHGIFEHQAVSCTPGIGVHFHETEIACDFSDVTFTNSFYQESPEVPIKAILYFDHRSGQYVVPSIETDVFDQQRRGPPRFL